MPSTRFILIRHGETQWNAEGREMGQLDSPLTALGTAQAERLAVRLAATPFDALYSSDLGRAVETARIASGLPAAAIRLDARLRERHTGIFQGLTTAEMESRYPAERNAHRTMGPDYVIAGGESAHQRTARTVHCLEELAIRHPDETVVAITHGGILMGLLEHVLGLPFGSGGKFRRANASWNVFVREPERWVLETWGDVSHLDPLG